MSLCNTLGHRRCAWKVPLGHHVQPEWYNQMSKEALEFILFALLLSWLYLMQCLCKYFVHWELTISQGSLQFVGQCVLLKMFLFWAEIQWTTFNLLELYGIWLLFQHTWAYWKIPTWKSALRKVLMKQKCPWVSFTSNYLLLYFGSDFNTGFVVH